MNETEDARSNSERPLAITAICVIGLINATQMINLIMSPMSRQIGAFYPAYFTVSVIVSLICIFGFPIVKVSKQPLVIHPGYIGGLWFLKRWAALTYAAVLVCNQLVLLKMGYWEVSAAVIPVIIVLLLFKYWPKMA